VSPYRRRWGLIVRRTAPGLILLALAAAAQATELDCQVTYLAADDVYVDAGAAQGLAEGALGVVRHKGVEVARVEVVSTSRTSARLRVIGAKGAGRPEVGDSVHFEVPDRTAPETEPPPATKETGQPFVPLLERQKSLAKAPSRRNVVHGWVSLTQLFRTQSSYDYWTTRLSSAGGVDRLGGTPWAVRWSGALSARGGDALEGTRLDVFELLATRRGEAGTLTLGRFVPRALSNVGYVDGALGERVLGGGWTVGGILGLKPMRDDLTPSLDEPVGVIYGTFTSGKPRERYYSGTLGVLGSLYEGDPDRLALLADQQLSFGSRFDIHASFEVDFDVGGAAVRRGTRLTYADLNANATLSEALTLRAGFDHYEKLDTQAERTALGYTDAALYDGGTWRYWVGSSHRLPASLRLATEFAILDAPQTDQALHWRVALTRSGLPSLPQASATLTVYNLEGELLTGLGGRLDAYLPFGDGRLTLQPAIGFRAFDSVVSGSFDVTDLGLRAEYRLDRKWGLSAGVAYTFGEAADLLAVDLGLRYRW
jgi:hypothetical protein